MHQLIRHVQLTRKSPQTTPCLALALTERGLVGLASLLRGELEPNRRDDLHEELMMQARCRSAVISARQRPSSALRAAYALAASPAELLDAYDAECNCVCVLLKLADSGLSALFLLGD